MDNPLLAEVDKELRRQLHVADGTINVDSLELSATVFTNPKCPSPGIYEATRSIIQQFYRATSRYASVRITELQTGIITIDDQSTISAYLEFEYRV